MTETPSDDTGREDTGNEDTVHFDPDTNRYIIERGRVYAGFGQVVLRGDQVVFIHTVVDEKFEGHGMGSRLIAAALEDVKAKGKRVVAICPFVTAYLVKHEEWEPLRDRPTSALLSSLAD